MSLRSSLQATRTYGYVSYFSTNLPHLAPHVVHRCTRLWMPNRNNFGVSPVTRFAPPTEPLYHLQISDPANVLSMGQTNKSLLVPSLACMLNVTILQTVESVGYPLYAQPCADGRCHAATKVLLRGDPSVSIGLWAATC
jgi:hypothetical protein